MKGQSTHEDWGTRKLVVFDDPSFDKHIHESDHPESSERLAVIRSAIAGHPWKIRPGRWATLPELERVHTPTHIERISSVDGKHAQLCPDTLTCPYSVTAAFMAAGASVEAAEIASAGGYAFVMCRPPGHHATGDEAMGFCLFNNAAIAAAHIAEKGKRVAILDFDVHHGNGTQDIFYSRSDVLYTSTHQYPFYPDTGGQDEMGEGPGLGYTLNVPIPSGADDNWLLPAFERIIFPAIEHFAPDVCIISAGYDGLADDPLGDLRYTAQALAWMIQQISAGWPTMAVLEGGYNLDTLGPAVCLSMQALAGAAISKPIVNATANWEAKLQAFKHPLITSNL